MNIYIYICIYIYIHIYIHTRIYICIYIIWLCTPWCEPSTSMAFMAHSKLCWLNLAASRRLNFPKLAEFLHRNIVMTIIFRRTTLSEQVGCVLIQYRLDLFRLFILFILVPTLEGRERMKTGNAIFKGCRSFFGTWKICGKHHLTYTILETLTYLF